MTTAATHILDLEREYLRSQGGLFTAQEIVQQPAVWARVQALVAQNQAAMSAFLGPLLAQRNLRIILTGAGTSAFIGQCLAPLLVQKTGLRVEAIPTTDLVSAPAQYLQAHVPTLLVSFARSGNSPESVAAVELADQLVTQISHLVVTCNPQGQLYERGRQQAHVQTLLLPEETHDRGFAMTSSFTSMLLSTACVFGVVGDSSLTNGTLAGAAARMLREALPLLNSLVGHKFSRVVYLGSNALKGLAQEAALKLMELSDGRVVGVHDSPLGFRHGPKTVVNADTLVVFFLSNDPVTRRYEVDLVHELRRDGHARKVVVLSAGGNSPHPAVQADYALGAEMADANAVELALPYIVFAQVFAFLQSLALGLRPDSPSVSGAVNRVVSGVTIYPYPSPPAASPATTGQAR